MEIIHARKKNIISVKQNEIYIIFIVKQSCPFIFDNHILELYLFIANSLLTLSIERLILRFMMSSRKFDK